jgi:hypothetical protein
MQTPRLKLKLKRLTKTMRKVEESASQRGREEGVAKLRVGDVAGIGQSGSGSGFGSAWAV